MTRLARLWAWLTDDETVGFDGPRRRAADRYPELYRGSTWRPTADITSAPHPMRRRGDRWPR